MVNWEPAPYCRPTPLPLHKPASRTGNRRHQHPRQARRLCACHRGRPVRRCDRDRVFHLNRPSAAGRIGCYQIFRVQASSQIVDLVIERLQQLLRSRLAAPALCSSRLAAHSPSPMWSSSHCIERLVGVLLIVSPRRSNRCQRLRSRTHPPDRVSYRALLDSSACRCGIAHRTA